MPPQTSSERVTIQLCINLLSVFYIKLFPSLSPAVFMCSTPGSTHCYPSTVSGYQSGCKTYVVDEQTTHSIYIGWNRWVCIHIQSGDLKQKRTIGSTVQERSRFAKRVQDQWDLLQKSSSINKRGSIAIWWTMLVLSNNSFGSFFFIFSRDVVQHTRLPQLCWSRNQRFPDCVYCSVVQGFHYLW